MNMLNILRKIMNRVLYSQDKELLLYEITCIFGVRSMLSDANAKILDRQLDRYDFIQRSTNKKTYDVF